MRTQHVRFLTSAAAVIAAVPFIFITQLAMGATINLTMDATGATSGFDENSTFLTPIPGATLTLRPSPGSAVLNLPSPMPDDPDRALHYQLGDPPSITWTI